MVLLILFQINRLSPLKVDFLVTYMTALGFVLMASG